MLEDMIYNILDNKLLICYDIQCLIGNSNLYKLIWFINYFTDIVVMC